MEIVEAVDIRTPVSVWCQAWFWTVLAVGFFVFMVTLSWTGFLESDDLFYARAAEGWLGHFPFLGNTHWALRHFIVLPTALFFAVLGRGVFALELPMLLYAAGICLLQGLAITRVAGGVAGALAVLLMLAVPGFAAGASMAFDDLPEAFFILASLWSFHFAVEGQRRGLFILAGVCAGCAFITRETTLVLLALYLVLFLAGYGRRLDYVWMGVGFTVVFGAETMLLWLASGDPLWRMHVALNGVAGDNPSMVQLQINQDGLDRHGVILAPRLLQPLIELFANQQLGLLAWLGVPAAVLLSRRAVPDGVKRPARLFGLLALFWFGILCYGLWFLWLVPRYQLLTECALAVPAALWIARQLAAGRRAVPLGVLAAMLGSGVLLSAAANHGQMFGEQALAAFAREHAGPIRTDPATLRGAEWLLELSGAQARVSAAAPQPGAVYFFNPKPRRALDPGWPVRAIPQGAVVLAQFEERPGPVAWVLRTLGIDRYLPGFLRDKLAPPPHTAEALQIPPG